MNQLKASLAVAGTAFVGVALHILIPEGNWLALALLAGGVACVTVALHD
jgi:hypothetical protein